MELICWMTFVVSIRLSFMKALICKPALNICPNACPTAYAFRPASPAEVLSHCAILPKGSIVLTLTPPMRLAEVTLKLGRSVDTLQPA